MDSRRMQLDQQQCWGRLRTAAVGRLSYTEFALPVIRAVSLVVYSASIVVALGYSAAFTRATMVRSGEWSLTCRQAGQCTSLAEHKRCRRTSMPRCETSDCNHGSMGS
jgi:hypothetical protein